MCDSVWRKYFKLRLTALGGMRGVAPKLLGSLLLLCIVDHLRTNTDTRRRIAGRVC